MARPADAADEWMSVYHDRQKIGYAHLVIRPESDGYSYEEEALLRLNVMEHPQTIRTVTRASTGSDFALKRVAFELINGGSVFRADGEVSGQVLRLRTHIGADESETELKLNGPVYLPATIRRSLSLGPLEAGRRIEAEVFDPSLMKEHRIVTTVREEENVPGTSPPVRGWRIEEEYGGITARAWLDREGRVLREEGPLGLSLVQESAEQAVSGNWEDATALDLVASAALPVDPPLEDARNLARLRLRLGGVDLSRVPTDRRQQLAGDVLTIEREVLPAQPLYTLPYDADEWRAEIAPSPLLQSDHPRLRSLAAEVIGEERRPTEVARRLAQHVFERLRKVPTVSVPNALQVLDSGEGDCNEHAVLFAALARAAGLPTRVVAGIVYLNDAFYYHAWDEVWLDRWVSIDPVFDQFPADATHVKFVAGGPEDHIAMIGVIGRLHVQVLPSDAKS